MRITGKVGATLIWIANHRIKIRIYNCVTYQNQTHILEWFVVRCGTKKQCQKYMWFQEIELRTQNMATFYYAHIANITGGSPM
jgi:hypothetical protein